MAIFYLRPKINAGFVFAHRLKPKENCVDIPKEVCTRSRRNPRKVKRPVIKKWCYTPTEESGLAGLSPPPTGGAQTNTPNAEQNSSSPSDVRRRN